MEGVLGEFGNLKIRDIYRQIDSKYIKPCLLRDNKVTPVPRVVLLSFCRKVRIS
jgi:hypothetical protein